MRTILLGLGAAAVIATSAAVISGQHAPAAHAEQHASPSHATVLKLCQPTGEQADRHLSMMAEHLALTSEQRASVERLTTEACAAMAKYHEQILAVLTAEQRAQLKYLHGHGAADDNESALHTLMKKLHGR